MCRRTKVSLRGMKYRESDGGTKIVQSGPSIVNKEEFFISVRRERRKGLRKSSFSQNSTLFLFLCISARVTVDWGL